MKLKLKEGLENTLIYVPFERQNILGKFIPEGLYSALYKKAPELFDVITEKKTIVKNDIPINNTKFSDNSNA